MSTHRSHTSSTSSTYPECTTPLKRDPKHGETVCRECGRIISADRLDRGPEWRAFNNQEYQQKARVGSPSSLTKHDKGLSTVISSVDVDANGHSLSARKRTQMRRLRKWDERYRTRDCAERHLKQALGEINRMASALGLPQSARETASVIYRRAHADGLLVGRSIEAVATSAVYAAARQEGIPRTLDEMTAVARIDRLPIARAYRTVDAELELVIEPADPTAYLPRFASDVGCSQTVHRQAHELLESVMGTPFMSGKHPAGLAAAALYASSRLTGEPITQREISDVADVSAMTIREHYRDLINNEQDNN